MTWTYEHFDSLDSVLPMYTRVFGTRLPAAEISRSAARKERLSCFVARARDGEAVAFAICRSAPNGIADLWHFGVLEEHRRRGAAKALVVEVERVLRGEGIRRLTVTTYNHWSGMLSLLIASGYRIYDTAYSAKRQDLKIKFRKELQPQRELRLALTDVCNFTCLFCHGEGLEDVRRGSVSCSVEQDIDDANRMLAVLQQAARSGHTDLTFTGGEPLLRAGLLQRLLDGIGLWPERDDPDIDGLPAVTLVTNGARLTADVIGFLCAYPGQLKINVSLHASDAETFASITGQPPETFSRVLDNVRRATTAGLALKINHVVLRGRTHTAEQLVGAVEQARGLGATAIKLLELLVVRDNAELYPEYYDARAIRRELERALPALQPRRTNVLRKWEYVHPDDPKFVVEVQRLTCQLGCSLCRLSRDRTISTTLRYHPCFVRTKESFDIRDPAQIDQIFAQGDRLIDGFAERYGDKSPTLLRVEQNVARKREIYFAVDDAESLSAFLVQQRFELESQLGFEERYFRPRRCDDAAWHRWERILRIGIDDHDQSKVDLIYADHSYHHRPIPSRNGPIGPSAASLLETETTFLYDDGPLQFARERAERLLDRLDFECVLHLRWELEFYRGTTADGIDLELSLSRQPVATLKLRCGDAAELDALMALRQQYPGTLEPLAVPLPEYVAATKK